jgi:hypothetical protein
VYPNNICTTKVYTQSYIKYKLFIPHHHAGISTSTLYVHVSSSGMEDDQDPKVYDSTHST